MIASNMQLMLDKWESKCLYNTRSEDSLASTVRGQYVKFRQIIQKKAKSSEMQLVNNILHGSA